MAHNKTAYAGLNKPDSLALKVDPAKMFVENIDQMEQNHLGIINSIRLSVGSAVELRTISTADTIRYIDGTMVLVRGVDIFYFDSSSTLTDDGINVIKPAVGPGRWVIATRINTFRTAGGTATAILIDGFILTNNNSVTFIASADNNSAPTTINGKPLYKPGTTTAPSIKSGKAVTVWYSLTGDRFFVKASSEGNVIAGHVLANDIFSNDDELGLVGTMVNYGDIQIPVAQQPNTQITSVVNAANGVDGGVYFKSGVTGRINQNTTLFQYVKNMRTENIKAGVKVGNDTNFMTGTFTSDATVLVEEIRTGKTAYKNGTKITGTMPEFLQNSFTIPTSTASPGNILLNIPKGYYDKDNASYYANDVNLAPENIIAGKTIFGNIGTAIKGLRFIKGIATSSATAVLFNYVNQQGTTGVTVYPVTVSGLSSKPDFILLNVSANNSLGVVQWRSIPANPGYREISDNTYWASCTPATNGVGWVNSSGFYLPSGATANTSVTWVAVYLDGQI